MKFKPMTSKELNEFGRTFVTGFMIGLQSGSAAQPNNIVNETQKRKWYGTFKGHNQWDLAKDWFQMSNDDFFNQYGFNFVPKGQLFDEAKRFLANQS